MTSLSRSSRVDPGFIRSVKDGVILSIRLTPKASSDRIAGLATAADGSQHIKVYVRAIPEKGRANKALSALIARYIGCAKSNVEVITGHTSRNKELLVAGDTVTLMAAAKALE